MLFGDPDWLDFFRVTNSLARLFLYTVEPALEALDALD